MTRALPVLRVNTNSGATNNPGSGFRVQNSGFKVQGLGSRVQGTGCGVLDLRTTASQNCEAVPRRARI